MLSATPETIQTLTLDIQKLRVAVALLREQRDGAADTSIYKDMALLNRLITGNDLEGSATRQKQEEAIKGATDRLAERGIGPDSATRIARVLSAVMAGGEKALEDDEGAEPDSPE